MGGTQGQSRRAQRGAGALSQDASVPLPPFSNNCHGIVNDVLEYKNIVPCENCVEDFGDFYPKVDWKIPRGHRRCENCDYEPDWTDAFSKWGHNDGSSNNYITSEIVDTIEELGYKCTVESWGTVHNREVIMEIVKCHNVQSP